MHRHFQIVVGRWKFGDWHLYRLTSHQDARTGKIHWSTWDRVL